MDTKLPNFLIIGAAKCGTTSLCDDIGRHPDVFISNPKEPEFFCRDEKYALGLDWYASLFSKARPDQIRGEGSTHYTDYPAMPESASRIAATLPNVRLVYMVRDPVRRAYSAWLQKLKNQDNFGGDRDVSRCFSEAIRNYSPLVEAGDYKIQLEQYLRHFDAGSIHVIIFDDYLKDRDSEIIRLGGFLNFDPQPLLRFGSVWSNESQRHFKTRARIRLAKELRKQPIIDRSRLLLPRPMRRRVLKSISESSIGQRYIEDESPARMSPQDAAFLWSRYETSVEWMETYLGRRLDGWRAPYRSEG